MQIEGNLNTLTLDFRVGYMVDVTNINIFGLSRIDIRVKIIITN